MPVQPEAHIEEQVSIASQPVPLDNSKRNNINVDIVNDNTNINIDNMNTWRISRNSGEITAIKYERT